MKLLQAIDISLGQAKKSKSNVYSPTKERRRLKISYFAFLFEKIRFLCKQKKIEKKKVVSKSTELTLNQFAIIY